MSGDDEIAGMNIGTVAARSGVPAKTIRYYENAGLIPPAPRGPNGYRRYGERDVQTLRFIQRARGLGFSVGDVGALLELWCNQRRGSAEVQALARRHVLRIEDKLRELDSIRRVLVDLMARCHGDDRPEYPTLDEIESARGDSAPRPARGAGRPGFPS